VAGFFRIGDAVPLPLLSLRLRGSLRGARKMEDASTAKFRITSFFFEMEIVSSSTQQYTVPYTYYSLIGTKFVAQ
jgi:hypothetical protein